MNSETSSNFNFQLAQGMGFMADALCAEVDGWRCFFETTDSAGNGWEWQIQTGGGWGGYRDLTPNVVVHAKGVGSTLCVAAEMCLEWINENGTSLQKR